MRNKVSIPFIALMLCLFAGGCGTLNKAGPYQGDKVLYDADLAIATSYDVIHSFVLWEHQSRASLTNLPWITIKANEIRQQAPGAFKAAIMLRDTYAATPNSGTRSALVQSVTVLRALMATALSIMTQHNTGTTNPNLNPIIPPNP